MQHTLESLDEDALSEWISTHGTTPFALGDEPLIRFHLASPGQDTGGFVLLIVMHHTIADYHSLETVTNQLTMTYLRLTTEVDSPIEPSALRLNDHCRLQFHSFSGAANQENRDFWVSALPQLTKPASAQIASRKRQTFLGYEHQMIVSPTICHRVKEFAKSMATTEFCVMFAAYALVYQKFFGGDEVIGTTATCRLTHPAPDIIGCYVNPVPVMMANASRDKSFTSWVVWVTRQVNDIMQHSDLAFNDLLALANVPRIPGRPVLIDTLFTWLRDDPRGNRQSGSMIGTIRLAKPLAIGVTHDLVCMVRTAGPDRSLILSHDAAVLDHQNVLQFAERYLEAMEHWLDSPDNMVGSSNDAQSDDLAETHREEFLF